MAYIKFQRGSLAAYQALTSYDDNTLYFVTPESGEGAVGRLYLGNKLISGGDVVLQSANLNDLADVIVDGAGTGDFLVRDEAGKWVPKTAADVAKEVLETLKLHKTLAYDTEGALGIAGFDDAENGAQLIKNDAGELVWVKPSTETVEGIQTTVAGLQSSVATLDGEVDAVVEDVTALEERADTVEQNLAALEVEVGNPAEGETPASGLYAELEALEGVVDTKANAADVYAKDEVDTLVTTAIANAEHLKRKLVDTLPAIEEADAHTIYMVPKEGGTDPDVRDEYMVVNGAWEKIGDTAVNLDGYATEAYVIEAIKNKAEIGASYTKTEADALLEGKANVGDAYTKAEANGLLDAKVNVADLATELNKKVDKVEGSRLMTEAEGTKLAGITEGAEVNVINAVSEEFEIGENRTLVFKNIAVSKVTDLADLLNAKAAQADLDALELRVKNIENQLGVSLTWVEMSESTT